MPHERLVDASALLLAHMKQEAAAGFARVRRIPNSGVIRFLDYAEGAPDLHALLESLARLHALGFLYTRDSHDTLLRAMAEDPMWLAMRSAMTSPHFSMGLRYAGLRMLKAVLSDRQSVEMMAKTRAGLDFTPRDDLPPELVPDPDPMHLKPAKAPQLRKLIDAAFKALFAPIKQKGLGGETIYSGAIDGTAFTVRVDFAARGVQLVHGVSIPDETRNVMVVGRAYEQLWGATTGWDYLTEENAEASIQLLADNVVALVGLRDQLKAL